MSISVKPKPCFSHDLWAEVSENITPFRWTVRRYMHERKLSQRALAKRLSIAASNLSSTLKGKKDRPLSHELVAKISIALELSSEEEQTLFDAAQLSMPMLQGMPPWKHSLAVRFHHELPAMEKNVAIAIDALFASSSSTQVSKIKTAHCDANTCVASQQKI